MLEILLALPLIFAAIAEVRDVSLGKHILASVMAGLVMAASLLPFSFLLALAIYEVKILGLVIPGELALFLPLFGFLYTLLTYWTTVGLTKVFERLTGL